MKLNLDTAIDHVAARMVAVPDDPEMVTRIVHALPDRSSRLGWLIPQLAALSAIVLAAVVWSIREQPATPVLPSGEIAAWAVPSIVVAHDPGTFRTLGTLRTQPSEPAEPPEPPEAREALAIDFDRSLPPLEVAALTLAPIEVLAPIEIGELPLTAETISSNKFE